MIKVTIGIPIYNSEKYLRDAVQSVLNQTYTDFELILLNDGSTDNSLDIIKDFEKNDPRVRVIDDGENKGLIFRLNQLIDLAEGKYFVRMDADDIMFPDRVEKQLECLESNQTIDLVHAYAVSINSKSEIIGIKNRHDNYSLIHPTVMAKKTFFLNNKYEEGFFQMEDLELWYRTKNAFNFQCLKEPLLFYREDSAKVSMKHKKMYLGLLNFCRKYNFTWLKTFKILFLNRVKYFSYLILEKFNLGQILINKRFEYLSEADKYSYFKILKLAVGRI